MSLFFHRTAHHSALSPSPTAANASPHAPPAISISAPSTHVRRPRPKPPINSPATYPIKAVIQPLL